MPLIWGRRKASPYFLRCHGQARPLHGHGEKNMGAVKYLAIMMMAALFLGMAAGPGLGAVCHQMKVHCTCGKSGWNVQTRTVKTIWDVKRAKCVPEGCDNWTPLPVRHGSGLCGQTVSDYCHWYIDKCTEPVDQNTNWWGICYENAGDPDESKSRPAVYMRLDSVHGGHRLSNVYSICPPGWSMRSTDYTD